MFGFNLSVLRTVSSNIKKTEAAYVCQGHNAERKDPLTLFSDPRDEPIGQRARRATPKDDENKEG